VQTSQKLAAFLYIIVDIVSKDAVEIEITQIA